jgi:hypothetical protein
MITTLNRGTLKELHTAILDLESRGYTVIAPATQIHEDNVKYKRGKYINLAKSKWVCQMKKAKGIDIDE